MKTFKNNMSLEPLEEVGDLFVDTIKINDLRQVLGEGRGLENSIIQLFQQAGLEVTVIQILK